MPNWFSEVFSRGRNAELKEDQREFSSRELSEVLLKLVPELKESLTQADIELALDDRGWLGLNTQKGFGELDVRTRTELVQRSRLYWARDPLAKQAVRLWTDYGVGKGITYQADPEDDGKADDTEADDPETSPIQVKLDKFFKYRKNKRLTASKGQQRLSKKLLIDGEIFFAIFDVDGNKVLRTIDPIQITEIVTDPDDEEEILCYKRVTSGTPSKTLYYLDWAADEADFEGLKDPQTKGDIKIEENVVIYHLTFDDIGKRGNGLLFSVLDWSREHRRFMEARVGLTQALAKFAYKLTAKGGQSVVNAIQTRLQSSLVNTGLAGSTEKNPQPAPGATWLQNAGLDMAPMPRATGAGDAKEDGNSLKLMHCAGTGTMLHYYGDPSTGNLATAEAMELPMLKAFGGYQELWKDFWRDLFAIVLEEDIDAEPAQITISLPRILAEDLVKLGQFLSALVLAFPEAKVPPVLGMLLGALGIDDISEVLEAIAEQKKENDQKAADIATQGPPPTPTPTAPVAASTSVAEIAAIDRLTEALAESARTPLPALQLPEPAPVKVEVVMPMPQDQVRKVIKEMAAAADRPRKRTVKFLKDSEGVTTGAEVTEVISG